MTLQHKMKFLRIEILVLHKIKKVSAIKKISLASSTAKQMGLVHEQQKKKLFLMLPSTQQMSNSNRSYVLIVRDGRH